MDHGVDPDLMSMPMVARITCAAMGLELHGAMAMISKTSRLSSRRPRASTCTPNPLPR